MREVTEGRAFDAIVEDEYRGIVDDSARQLYGLACVFGRLRAGIRDSVAAEVLEINIADLYSERMQGVEGIIRFEEIDPARGISQQLPATK